MTGALLALLLAADIGPHARATLLFGGDVIPHAPLKDAVRAAAKRDPEQAVAAWAELLAPLEPTFAAADFSLVNLETPVVTLKKPFKGEWIFHAGPELPAALARVGVRAVSFANNHARDQHFAGIVETRRHLEAAGLKAVGAAGDTRAAWEPLVVDLRGIKVGFFAFTRFLNHFKNKKDPKVPHVPFVPYASEPRDGGATVKQLLARVKEMRARCDALVVLAHWGDEYAVGPKLSDQVLAEQLLDAGATAVVGTHPHVAQPARRHKEGDDQRLVAFSLGNLLSNQEPDDFRHPARSGLLLELTLEKVGTVTRLASSRPVPIWTDNLPARGGRRAVAMPIPAAVKLYEDAAAAEEKEWKKKKLLRRAEALTREAARLEALAPAF